MIAQIIPLIRSPRGKDIFDYDIPPSLPIAVARGSMVRIPFRKKIVVGIVRAVGTSSPITKRRMIVEILPTTYAVTSPRWKLLEWFADYYYCSRSMAAKIFIVSPPLSRRHAQKNKNRLPSVAVEARPPLQPQRDHAVTQVLAKLRAIHIVRFRNRKNCLALYKKIVQQKTGPAIIIVPEYSNVAEVAQAFGGNPDIHLYAWTTPPSPSRYYECYNAINATPNARHVLIGTRRLIFFPMEHIQTLIIDQEDEKAHHQFDQHPRYHVRSIALKIAHFYQSRGLQLLFTSRAPSVVLAAKQPIINIARDPRPGRIVLADMEEEKRRGNYSWFSEILKDHIRHAHRSFLFLNRRGTFRLALCSDCSSILPLATVRCPHCGSVRIHHRGKGVQQLGVECRALFPHKRIAIIDRDVPKRQDNNDLQKAEIIIGTEKALRLLPIASFSLLGILSVDHLLVYPHWQAHEHVFQLLAKLTSFDIPTILQTHAPHHPVLRAALTNNYELFLNEELSMRNSLHLPPFGELFEWYNPKTKTTTYSTKPPDRATLSSSSTLLVDRAFVL